MRVTAVINAHREGLLAGPSLLSFKEAISFAQASGIDVEPIAILDRCDGLTRAVFDEADIPNFRMASLDCGDLGLARNRGVQESSGDYVTFLDADDLWSFNWIADALSYSLRSDKPFVAHSEVNVAFGRLNEIWLHVDSDAAGTDLTYLGLSNYWDSLCFAPRTTLLECPYHKTDLAAGYGYEDWHWNMVTLLAGYAHRPVPGTVHFKRKRANSLSAVSAARSVVPWPTDLATYDAVKTLPRSPAQAGTRLVGSANADQ